MQPQRQSQRLSKAKQSNQSEKQLEEKKKTGKPQFKKSSQLDLGAKQPLKKGSRLNLQAKNVENNNHEDINDTILDTSASQSRNQETSIDMSIFESDTPGKSSGSHASNLRRAKKVTNTSVSEATNNDTSIDMSIFESDTPSRNYGSHGLNFKRANKGISGNEDSESQKLSKLPSTRERNINVSERVSNINYQQKEPKSSLSSPSGNKKKGTTSFGYQENESSVHPTWRKTSITGVNSQPNKGNRFNSSAFHSDTRGMKQQFKKGNVMQSSSVGNFHQGQKTSELRITHIKDVNPMINNMAIKGRCISIWHSHKLNEEHDPYSLDCVFQDVEDERIQVYIKKEFMFKFEPLLKEGQCYMISNFGVAENGGRLPLLPSRWKISFFKGTNVTRIDQIDHNFVGFINEPFTRILDPNNEYHEHDCVDVIGTVVAVGNIVPVNSHTGTKIRRTVVIEDAQSYTLECTFWDKWALMWNEYDNRLEDIGHLDILLMLGKIKYWDNKPSVHNALFGSKIYINRKIPQLLSFRESYESQEGYDAGEFKIQVHSQDRHVITPAEFMQGCVKRLVGMIRTIEPETCCVVYATVHSIQYQNGWAYIGCKECNTKVTPVAAKGGMNSRNKSQLWFCKRHGETYAVSCRFKIIVRIVDESGTAQIVIFDNNVHKMTKMTAWEIIQEHGVNTDEYFPDDLNQIIGKQYLFKIKYTEFNHQNNSHIYRTEKVTDDVDTINHFKDGFLEEENNDEDYENGDYYYDNSGDEYEKREDDSENGGDDFEISDDELTTSKGEFHNDGHDSENHKGEFHNNGDHDSHNDEDELVDREEELEDTDNMNIQASNNVEQDVEDDIETQTEFVYEDSLGVTDIDHMNTRMTDGDLLTNNACDGIDKKRGREVLDVLPQEPIDGNHEQRKKKMTTKDITKDV